jgi:hypothetical protein
MYQPLYTAGTTVPVQNILVVKDIVTLAIEKADRLRATGFSFSDTAVTNAL